MSYLLSIEVRRGDSVTGDVGEIVALDQAWCDDVADVLEELRVLSVRTRGRIQFVRGVPLEREIEADPRRKGVTERAAEA